MPRKTSHRLPDLTAFVNAITRLLAELRRWGPLLQCAAPFVWLAIAPYLMDVPAPR
ncbi:hypothetical protein ABXN37_19755 [Piscinibacter sakaiensis]|uniref:Uncharacterized protein n=1 Tax=Piscinibacter sakaiensis TaxID=1547922 RepID=A0A0K8P417_PISS1|nr:hypothetical protein [Piscinibacter sakaiensis]GAP37362.1 hypothetical protein ISF6_3217 [Piscinibacter sakaiensis]